MEEWRNQTQGADEAAHASLSGDHKRRVRGERPARTGYEALGLRTEDKALPASPSERGGCARAYYPRLGVVNAAKTA